VRILRLDVAYDGTAFHGWQIQPDQRTVQGVLEEALAIVLQEEVRLKGAGRTDTGCHARGQVASFATGSTLPVRALAPLVRRHLPGDVQVLAARDAAPDFDARRSARARRYAYRLLHAPDVLWGRIAWHPRRALDPEKLACAVRPLEGERDCASFAASGSTPTPSRCHVQHAAWRHWEGGLQLDLIADHFLYHMVRNVVGTALMVMDGPDPSAAMASILEARSRKAAGPTAPPEGLCLEQVFYAEDGA
jgi:tRNA pseudouridine38-40 synthase